MKSNLDRWYERLYVYNRAGGYCETCGKPLDRDAFEVAHKIANTISNRRKYGERVVDHVLNKAATHRGRCNSAQNCGFNPMKCQAIVEAINGGRHGGDVHD